MSENTLKITVDDRVRLLSAALSVTNFPHLAQQRKRHHAHAHARATQKYLIDHGYATHPAIATLQGLLNNNISLSALFGMVLSFDPQTFAAPAAPMWMPSGFNAQLYEFMQVAALRDFWAIHQHKSAWEDAQEQSRNIFKTVHFKTFLKRFFGEVSEELVFMPNISYPAEQEVGVRTPTQLISIVPPPLAWGESPPWPYDEETNITHSYRAALAQYIQLLLRDYLKQHPDRLAEARQKDLPVTGHLNAQYPSWELQFIALIVSGSVAIYLEDYVSKLEAEAFTLMEKRAYGMSILPAVVSVLRRYMQEHGSRYQELADFLTIFPAQLRVAKKIVAM